MNNFIHISKIFIIPDRTKHVSLILFERCMQENFYV